MSRGKPREMVLKTDDEIAMDVVVDGADIGFVRGFAAGVEGKLVIALSAAVVGLEGILVAGELKVIRAGSDVVVASVMFIL